MDPHPFLFTSRAATSPMPTSITSCRSMRIDYILLQPSLLEVQASLVEMGQADNKREGDECPMFLLDSPDDHIPNERHPSDHIPIAFRVLFKDRIHSAAEGCAASWVEAVTSTSNHDKNDNETLSPKDVLSLEELEAAFSYFDENGNGIFDTAELSSGLRRLGVGTGTAEALERVLREDASWQQEPLTPDEFRSLYVKIWLRQQSCFRDRVRSVRNMFHLSVDSKNFSSSGRHTTGEHGDEWLFCEMDVNNDGIVTVEDVIDHLAKVERSEDSLHARIADAFSLFDLDSGKEFSMPELHQCFVDACPFDVSTDILQLAFDDMRKAHDDRVPLHDFIDWLIRMYFRKDMGWISRVGPIPK